MITILHGDNTEASRAELRRLIDAAKGKEIRTVNGSTDPAALTQALESSSLFGGDTLIVLENLFAKLGRKTKLIESLAKTIVASASTADIVIWEEKELGVTVLKSLGTASVRLYKMPVIIFQLLDGLRPQSASTLLPLYHKVIALQAPEILYVLFVRRVRQLIQLSDNVMPEGLAPWQATRLTAQARLFTIDKLISLHTQLLDMDIAIKTGASPFTLAQLIEQFLISL
jgi:DNA polymerase III delta subunit